MTQRRKLINYPQLSTGRFQELVSKTKLRTESVKAAKLVLCEKLNCTEAGKRLNISQPTVSYAVNKLLFLDEKVQSNIPSGYRWVFALVPESVADKVEAIAKEAKPVYEHL